MKTKTLKITTDDKISVIEVDVNNIKDLQNAIGGGLVEPVKTQKLWDYFKAPVLMLVDEEGLLKDLPLNFFGIVSGYDEITDTQVKKPVIRKILKVQDGNVSIDYKLEGEN